MAVRNEVLEKDPKSIKKIIKVINSQLKNFKNPLEEKGLDRLFAERYSQQLVDIRKWLSITKWNRKKTISKKLINDIQNKLVTFSVISQRVDAKKLLKKLN